MEDALLESHVAKCDACRRFALDAAAFTAALRSELLEPTEEFATLPLPSRRVRFRNLEVATASLVTVAAGIAGVAVSLDSGKRTPQVDRGVVSARTQQVSTDDTIGVVAARRAHLLATTSRAWVPRRGVKLSET